MTHSMIPIVRAINLGRISYNKALQVQGHFQNKLLEDSNSSHILLLLEHDPVYTLGFRELIKPEVEKKLNDCGAEVVKSNRGGLTTFHGPGQLVVYPIINLKKFRNMSLRRYVEALEMTAIHTCRMLGVAAVHGQESVAHTGAWINDKKICAIGVHCKRYITTHGLALNCNTDLDWYNHITPCGIPNKGVTSLTSELAGDVPIKAVIPQFVTSFETIFACQLYEAEATLNQACRQ